MKIPLSKYVGQSEIGLRGKFTALSAYIRKGETSKISNLRFHLRKPEKKSEN